MAPRKLSDSDKSDIIELYRQPEHTTSTLAGQYGVSNSTVSRILKTSIPPEEYSELISQKRMAGSDKTDAPAKAKPGRKRTRRKTSAKKVEADTNADEADEAGTTVAPPKLKTAEQAEEPKSATPTRRRRRRRKSEDTDEQLPLLAAEETTPSEAEETADTAADEVLPEEAAILLSDDDALTELDETLVGEEFDDDEDELAEDEEDEDEETALEPPAPPKLQPKAAMSIMPLGEAVLPKPCYLVVDMRAELITRPLSDFADLGQIPSSEEKAKTLPVFDNHRVARRFSRNKQRVIKVPDGNLITRTSPYLKAKGITRLLVDGQVFDV
ncbi:MAG: transposase [Cyanobacteria bacterium P01_F01_bin.53]